LIRTHGPFCGACRKEKQSLATKTLRAWAAARDPKDELKEDDGEENELEEEEGMAEDSDVKE
jgi:hypothetical protein